MQAMPAVAPIWITALYNTSTHLCTTVTPMAVNITGTNIFNSNYGDGLDVYTKGAISLNSITANSNGQSGNPSYGYGATLDNTSASSAQPIILSGANQFNGNEGAGLEALSNGAITASNLTADGNLTWYGVYLGNTSPLTAQPVTVSGSVTNNNKYYGLIVWSKGFVTLSNITASSNGSYLIGSDYYTGEGVYVNNAGGVAGFTLTGTNVINSNSTNGLEVYSNGPISVNNLTANDNGYFDSPIDTKDDAVQGFGASLNNSTASTPQPITLTGTNQFNNNWYDGLDVDAKEVITLTSITANDNGLGQDATNTYGDGVYAVNSYNPASPQLVSILGTNQFSNNWLDGLDVYSYGTITLNSATASGNRNANFPGDGAYLDNCNITVSACTTVTPMTINITGTNTFNSNYGNGLVAFSKGAVAINSITANGNGLADPQTRMPLQILQALACMWITT